MQTHPQLQEENRGVSPPIHGGPRVSRTEWKEVYKNQRAKGPQLVYVPGNSSTSPPSKDGREDLSISMPSHDAYAYHNTRARPRPLINFVNNSWRKVSSPPNSPLYKSSYDTLPSWTQLFTAPRFRRYVLVIFCIFALCWTNWRWWGNGSWQKRRDVWDEEAILKDAVTSRMENEDGWFGANLRPVFLDMIHTRALESDRIPSIGNGKRLVVVGDVHGCYNECEFVQLHRFHYFPHATSPELFGSIRHIDASGCDSKYGIREHELIVCHQWSNSYYEYPTTPPQTTSSSPAISSPKAPPQPESSTSP